MPPNRLRKLASIRAIVSASKRSVLYTNDAVNPFSGALNAYDAVVIDSQGILQQGMHVLPVMVWLAATLLFALGSVRALSR